MSMHSFKTAELKAKQDVDTAILKNKGVLHYNRYDILNERAKSYIFAATMFLIGLGIGILLNK